VQCGFFLRKKPLSHCGFALEQLEDRCSRSGTQATPVRTGLPVKSAPIERRNEEENKSKKGERKMRKLLLAIAIAALPSIGAAQNPTAKVEQGLLQGSVEEGLTVYRGIPFAAPPVGNLRWRAPEPAA